MKSKNLNRTYFNKIIEIIFALKYSLITRDETIIQEWCTIAPFGGNTIGVKLPHSDTLEDLLTGSPGQNMPLLAVMPNGPTHRRFQKQECP
ncbi:MAG: hypothetical protein IPO37_03510 [Saprospiraceae bacterium]|nr:hypothetical protein [Saprospiraceae bacterium]